jgi:hypothetical protein
MPESAATAGWVRPPGGRRRKAGVFVIGVVILSGLVLAVPLGFLYLLDSASTTGSPSIQTIGFGTAGSGCELTDVRSTFPTGATVRMVATFSPLPNSATDSLTRDAIAVDDPTKVTLDGSQPCVNGTLPGLEAGHYKMVITTIPASEMPPLIGEFDVTP